MLVLKKIFVLAILMFSSLALAQNDTDWIFREVDYAGDSEMTPSLYHDGENIIKIESTEESTGIFKLATIMDHPPADSWEVTMKVRITAPDIDLDNDENSLAGDIDETDDNDGPNFMAFIYGYEDSTIEKPGFITDTQSFLSYPSDSELCHVHFECNWAGDTADYFGYYCSSFSQYMKSAWVADGEDYLSFEGGYSTYGSEPFQPGEWTNVELSINAGECMYDRLTLTLMGADFFSNREYTWEIKDITIDAGVDEKLQMEKMYDFMEQEYVPKPAFCGNKQLDEGEECDGEEGLKKGFLCNEDCEMETECGDGIVAGEEVCDSSDVEEGYECSSDCTEKTPVCGDGLVVEGEMCDPESSEDIPKGFVCSSDCASMEPVCGDGIVVGNEECDGTNGTQEGEGCSNNCMTYRILNDDENKMAQNFLTLASQSSPGSPASIGVNFSDTGTLSVNDLKDQIDLNNKTDLKNYTIKLCVGENPECEKEYMLEGNTVYASGETIAFKKAHGMLKVYTKENIGTKEYHVGFKVEGGASREPLVGDWGLLAVAIGALIIIGGLLIMIGFLVVFYFRKKKKKKESKPSKKTKKK